MKYSRNLNLVSIIVTLFISVLGCQYGYVSPQQTKSVTPQPSQRSGGIVVSGDSSDNDGLVIRAGFTPTPKPPSPTPGQSSSPTVGVTASPTTSPTIVPTATPKPPTPSPQPSGTVQSLTSADFSQLSGSRVGQAYGNIPQSILQDLTSQDVVRARANLKQVIEQKITYASGVVEYPPELHDLALKRREVRLYYPQLASSVITTLPYGSAQLTNGMNAGGQEMSDRMRFSLSFGARSNADIEVVFEKLSGSTLGEARVTYELKYSPLIGPYFAVSGIPMITIDLWKMTSNSTFAVNVVYEEATRAIQKVLAHEIGHCLGLGHIDIENDLMYPYTSVSARKGTTEKPWWYPLGGQDGLSYYIYTNDDYPFDDASNVTVRMLSALTQMSQFFPTQSTIQHTQSLPITFTKVWRTTRGQCQVSVH